MECPSCGMTLLRGATFCASCGEQVPAGLTSALSANAKRTTSLLADGEIEMAIPPTQAIGPDRIPGKTESSCPRCGSPVNPSARFCAICGRPVVPSALNKTLDATRSAAQRSYSAFRLSLSKAMRVLASSKADWHSIVPIALSALLGVFALVKYIFFTPSAEASVSQITRLNAQVSVLVWLAFSLLCALIGLFLKR